MAWGWGPSTCEHAHVIKTYYQELKQDPYIPVYRGDRSDMSGRQCSNHHLRPVALLPPRGQFPSGGAWHYDFVYTLHLGSSGVGLRI